MMSVMVAASGCSQAADEPAVSSVRPSAVSSLAPGAPCPVTRPSDPIRPSPGLGDMIGTDPVRPVGLGAGAVLRFSVPSDSPGNPWPGSEWGGGKVIWAIAPELAASVVITGQQLDGTGALRFGQANVPDLALELPAAPAGASDTPNLDGWRSFPSAVRLQQEGCYAFRIDTPTDNYTIVFTARRF